MSRPTASDKNVVCMKMTPDAECKRIRGFVMSESLYPFCFRPPVTPNLDKGPTFAKRTCSIARKHQKNPLVSERAFGGVKWARTIDLYDVKTDGRLLVRRNGFCSSVCTIVGQTMARMNDLRARMVFSLCWEMQRGGICFLMEMELLRTKYQ